MSKKLFLCALISCTSIQGVFDYSLPFDSIKKKLNEQNNTRLRALQQYLYNRYAWHYNYIFKVPLNSDDAKPLFSINHATFLERIQPQNIENLRALTSDEILNTFGERTGDNFENVDAIGNIVAYFNTIEEYEQSGKVFKSLNDFVDMVTNGNRINQEKLLTTYNLISLLLDKLKEEGNITRNNEISEKLKKKNLNILARNLAESVNTKEQQLKRKISAIIQSIKQLYSDLQTAEKNQKTEIDTLTNKYLKDITTNVSNVKTNLPNIEVNLDKFLSDYDLKIDNYKKDLTNIADEIQQLKNTDKKNLEDFKLVLPGEQIKELTEALLKSKKEIKSSINNSKRQIIIAIIRQVIENNITAVPELTMETTQEFLKKHDTILKQIKLDNIGLLDTLPKNTLDTIQKRIQENYIAPIQNNIDQLQNIQNEDLKKQLAKTKELLATFKQALEQHFSTNVMEPLKQKIEQRRQELTKKSEQPVQLTPEQIAQANLAVNKLGQSLFEVKQLA